MSLAPQAGLGHRGAGGGFFVNADAQSKQHVRPHQIGLLARAVLPTDTRPTSKSLSGSGTRWRANQPIFRQFSLSRQTTVGRRELREEERMAMTAVGLVFSASPTTVIIILSSPLNFLHLIVFHTQIIEQVHFVTFNASLLFSFAE